MSRWFRLYDEMLDDPKVQGLQPEVFRAFVNLCCVASKYPESIVSDRDMAWRLRVDDASWKMMKDQLSSAGLVSHDNRPVYEGLGTGQARMPAALWAETRERIFERDDYTCVYCGEKGGKLQCDHVIPVSRAGSNDDSNLVTSCRSCNQAKRDKIVSIEEWSSIRRRTS